MSSTATTTYTGSVKRIFYLNQEAPSMAGVLATDGGDIRFQGKVAGNLGETIEVAGTWGTHEKFGAQFTVTSGKVKLDETPEGIAHLLANDANFTGVGLATALKIVKAAGHLAEEQGNDISEILANQPSGIQERSGVRLEVVENAAEVWSAKRSFYEMASHLCDQGWSNGQANSIINEFGDNAMTMIGENPYRLIGKIDRFGFRTVDAVAAKMGVSPNDPRRLRAGVNYCLDQIAQNGSTFTTREGILDSARRELNPDTFEGENMISEALDQLIDEGNVIEDVGPDGQEIIAATHLARAEFYICGWLDAALRDDSIPELTIDPNDETVASLNDDQFAALKGIAHHRAGIVSGGAGVGKAQPVDEPVLTPTGFEKMGRIGVGDYAIGSNGAPTRVVGVYPQGELQTYRVTFTDGSWTDCCEDHLWHTTSQSERDRCKPGSTKSLGEIMDKPLVVNGKRQHWIPIASPAEFKSAGDLPIDPYCLGLLLGDGGMTAGLSFHNPSQEIRAALADGLGGGVRLVPRDEVSVGVAYHGLANNPTTDALRAMNLHGLKSVEKFVPEEYLLASDGDRLAIIQGLMDTDGHANGHVAEFSTSSPRLIEGMKFLVQSLGGTLSVSSRLPTYTYKGEKLTGSRNWRAVLRMPYGVSPFRLKRGYKHAGKYNPRRAIESIESRGAQDCQCIAVDAPDRLYLTRDFIVTHNTYTMSAICSVAKSNGLRVALCAPTGKAAKRLSQSTGREALTIHRLLEPYRDDDTGGMRFARGAGNPIEASLVVVDEVSMVDVQLMQSLLRALPQGCRLLLVGDHNQIPSVGPGAILRDILENVERYDSVRVLDKVVRQAGTLDRNTRAILEGNVRMDNCPAWGINFCDRGHEDGIPVMVSQIVDKLATLDGVDPAFDIQVLSPQRKGPLGTYALNAELQALRQRRLGNPPPPRAKVGDQPKPVQGDRIIWTKNDYELDLFNGTQATVQKVNKNGSLVILTDDGLEKDISAGKRKHLELAYAITFHKSQGSEWPFVVMIASSKHYFMHDRNLLYTGAGRASKSLTIVGDPKGIRSFANATKSNRRSTLGQFLMAGNWLPSFANSAR